MLDILGRRVDSPPGIRVRSRRRGVARSHGAAAANARERPRTTVRVRRRDVAASGAATSPPRRRGGSEVSIPERLADRGGAAAVPRMLDAREALRNDRPRPEPRRRRDVAATSPRRPRSPRGATHFFFGVASSHFVFGGGGVLSGVASSMGAGGVFRSSSSGGV